MFETIIKFMSSRNSTTPMVENVVYVETTIHQPTNNKNLALVISMLQEL